MFASVALAQPGIAACRPPHDKYPFCDTTLSTDARIKDLVGRIHDEDKPNLLTARGRHMDHGRQALPYIGVPSFYWGPLRRAECPRASHSLAQWRRTTSPRRARRAWSCEKEL